MVLTIMIVCVLVSEPTSDEAVRCCSSCFNRVIRMINNTESGGTAEATDGMLNQSVNQSIRVI